jgi:26S proteasome regulatory subunit N5
VADQAAVDDADVVPVERQRTALESCIVFLLTSKFDNHQNDMMHRLKIQLPTIFKTVQLDPAYVAALGLFTTHEIVPTPFPQQQALFEQHSSLQRTEHMSSEIADHFREQLKVRVIQHNLRVVARYYTRIHTVRLATLLGLTLEALEGHLAELSSGGDLYLKIDRPMGIVTFQAHRLPEQVLTEWSSDVTKMLQLMESTCHLINRENMVHKV